VHDEQQERDTYARADGDTDFVLSGNANACSDRHAAAVAHIELFVWLPCLRFELEFKQRFRD